MENINIKNASKNDWSLVQNLEKAVRGKFYSSAVTKKDIINYINNESVLLANIQNNTTIGKISYSIKSNVIEISGLIILPEWRGRGYGAYLTNYVINRFPQSKYFELTVHPENKPAIDIYKKIGFKITKTIKNMYGDGESRYVMTLVKK